MGLTARGVRDAPRVGFEVVRCGEGEAGLYEEDAREVDASSQEKGVGVCEARGR